jgi:hypothetical protein
MVTNHTIPQIVLVQRRGVRCSKCGGWVKPWKAVVNLVPSQQAEQIQKLYTDTGEEFTDSEIDQIENVQELQEAIFNRSQMRVVK